MNQNPGYPLANENVPYNPDLEHFLPMGQQMTEVHQVQVSEEQTFSSGLKLLHTYAIFFKICFMFRDCR